MWSDKKNRLYFVETETKKTTLGVHAEAWEIRDYNWSPDSKWIVYSKPEVDVMTKVYIYSLDAKESYAVTDGWFSSYGGAFSADGKYLFFISNRSFNPTYGQTEWNHIYQDVAKIYLVTLSKDVKSPFEPKSDEVKVTEEQKEVEKDKEKEKEK